ncbi:MAG: hypothetical protein CMI76_00080 [Candidatus Pelagibacter sp.]|nr:hypothetical protein [Candidatus Pelagibacter sp.]|tara:strand:+ start:2709 stop:3332 length:624 start_codon:yes stop_codon:yes gene_type:complete
MKIITIFLSSINKYGVKFLFFIFLYEFINAYRLRFSDYLVLNPIKKKYEPCVPTPYYCLSLIEKKIIKKNYTFIDFGCGRGRVIDLIKKNKNVKKIIGIENNIKLRKQLMKLNDHKTKIYINDCSDNHFLNFLTKNYSKNNLILYFYHPFSEKILSLILKKFLNKNKKELKIIIMGEIYISLKIKKKFQIKVEKIHKLLNIYSYKYQ